jgi:uncharacterized protein YozE (UPF0346 family)
VHTEFDIYVFIIKLSYVLEHINKHSNNKKRFENQLYEQSKGPKQGRQNRLMSSMSKGGES